MIAAGALLAQVGVAAAQQPPLEPGEAVVTRFSGTTAVSGPNNQPLTLIDPAGVVAAVVDLRSPNRPPQGHQWFDKPQRNVAYAAQVGQVFGTALDDASPPNVYLAATSAFGLHRLPGNDQWMPGMWGIGGGPGTVYVLEAENGYQPRPFADIRLNGRPNSAAALGNITFDRWNRQFFVSDLETGMIHRIRAEDGVDLGYYDHGVQGRTNFTDASSDQQISMPPILFDFSSQARIDDCPTGEFQYSPECWNLAPNGRRVWGLAVARSARGGEIRLYYSVASSPEYDPDGWNGLSNEEKRNSVWSVRIGPGGAFDVSNVRREFILPDFFVDPQDVARAGYSRPVSDIAFPGFSQHPVMLVAERGGIRNFGLDQENSFATPHESRALRYELYQDGVWRPVGRYDVGSYHRNAEGAPRLLANSAGGAAFGYGYDDANWTLDRQKPDETVWMTGDALCSPTGPCNIPGQGRQTDPSEVHGLQGMRHSALAELAPAAAFAPADPSAPPTQSVGLDQSFLIDSDIAFDENGQPIAEEFIRNDATRVGDVAIYETGPTQPRGIAPVLPPPPVVIYEPGHSASASHSRFASHSTNVSHFRYGSHWPAMSHNRWGSHAPPGSFKHWPPGSWAHLPPGSVKHLPPGSVKHVPPGSIHFPPGSKHLPPGSIHFPPGSIHFPPGSKLHLPPGSVHFPPGSKLHILPNSPKHQPPGSVHFPPGSGHFPPGSKLHILPNSPKHVPPGSKLHVPPGSVHFPPGSKLHILPNSPKHVPPGSKLHLPPGSKHFPPGSKLHILPDSPKAHFPPGSLKAHVLPNSPKHQPPGSVHFPPGSKGHFPPGSEKAHKLPDSPKVHFPPGSDLKAHKLPDSPKVHVPPGSGKVHFPPGSDLKAHKLPDSPKVHVPPGSGKVHFPPGSDLKAHKLPDSPKVHVPPGSGKVHFPPGSDLKAHKLPDSPKVHSPPGSAVKDPPKVHLPPGSGKVHFPPGSDLKAHKLPASPKAHSLPASAVEDAPKVHLPPGSGKVHFPPGSVKIPTPKDVGPPKVAPPKVTKPEVTQPKVTQPKVTLPKGVAPKKVEPKKTTPKVVVPKRVTPAPKVQKPTTQQQKVKPKDDEDDEEEEKKFDLRNLFRRQN